MAADYNWDNLMPIMLCDELRQALWAVDHADVCDNMKIDSKWH